MNINDWLRNFLNIRKQTMKIRQTIHWTGPSVWEHWTAGYEVKGKQSSKLSIIPLACLSHTSVWNFPPSPHGPNLGPYAPLRSGIRPVRLEINLANGPAQARLGVHSIIPASRPYPRAVDFKSLKRPRRRSIRESSANANGPEIHGPTMAWPMQWPCSNQLVTPPRIVTWKPLKIQQPCTLDHGCVRPQKSSIGKTADKPFKTGIRDSLLQTVNERPFKPTVIQHSSIWRLADENHCNRWNIGL